MKKTILIPLIFLSNYIIAQETVGSTGEDLSNSDSKISLTIGESIIQEFTNGNHTISNGYHQPTIKIKTISIKETEYWKINIYPNPSQNTIHINWNPNSIQELSYQLLSIEGKLITEGISTELFAINISELSAGNYFLMLNSNNETQTYRIQKIK